MPLELFAVTQPGLEDICAAEVAEFGLGPGTTVPGGVAFQGEASQLATANLRLSVATRVLVRVAEFRAPGFPELHARAGKLAWERFIPTDVTPRLCFHVSAHKSRLYHTAGIAERVARGIGERLAITPEIVAPGDDDAETDDTRPPTRIYVRLDHDRCTVSVDSSGDPLHRRGYRLALARAPLRPTLAAAMLRACGWQPGAPLLDPMCGSGTIVLEAARRACGRPPGGDREFAFLAWPGLPGRAALAQARGYLSPETGASHTAPILGSDRDPGAITAARANAERAGVADAVTLAVRPLSAIEPLPAPGFVVCNPPYGVRVGKRGPLRDLYAGLGHVLRDRCPGARVALLCGDDLWHHCGLPLGVTHHLKNGGLPVQLVQGRVPA